MARKAAEKKDREMKAARAREKQAAERKLAERKAAERKQQQSRPREVAARKPAQTDGQARSAVLKSEQGLKMSNIAKETPAPKREEAATSSSKSYSLQLGAFRSEDAAQRMARTLRQQGFRPFIVRRGQTYLVRVGKSDAVAELWSLESRLREANYRPLRVSGK